MNSWFRFLMSRTCGIINQTGTIKLGKILVYKFIKIFFSSIFQVNHPLTSPFITSIELQNYHCREESKSAQEEFGGIQNHIDYREESNSPRSPKLGGFQRGILGEFQRGIFGEFQGGFESNLCKEESKSPQSPKVGGFQEGILGGFQGGLMGEFQGSLMGEFQGGFQDEFQDEGEIHDYLFREDSEPEIDFDEYAPDDWKNLKFDSEELLKATGSSTLRRTKGSN